MFIRVNSNTNKPTQWPRRLTKATQTRSNHNSLTSLISSQVSEFSWVKGSIINELNSPQQQQLWLFRQLDWDQSHQQWHVQVAGQWSNRALNMNRRLKLIFSRVLCACLVYGVVAAWSLTVLILARAQIIPVQTVAPTWAVTRIEKENRLDGECNENVLICILRENVFPVWSFQ